MPVGQSKDGVKRAVLEFISGPNSKEMIKLRRDATILGREKGDIVINDTEVSATHCQIQNIEGTFHIFDMNSTNGTFVNSEKIVKAKLHEGDVVTIGSTSFRFILREDREVRHVHTVFRSKSEKTAATSIVDTLIESELQSTQSSSIRLAVTYSTGKSEEIVLRQRIIFIGRASSFGHFDQDKEISRKHLMIKVNDGGEVFIEDQGSTNGTFLNGKKINGMHPVSPNDLIKVGGIQLRVMAQAS